MSEENFNPSASQRRRAPHKRLTAEQVRQNWELGDYTASGYLYHLIGALKRDGWHLTIANVDQFCQKWKLTRRSFFRAKAKLILQNRIEETISGKVELWINPNPGIIPLAEDFNDFKSAKFGTEGDRFGTPDAKFGTEDDRFGTPTPSKAAPDQRLGDPSDLLQISSDLSHSHPPNTLERELFDADGEPSQLYREWLIRRAQDLPKPPAMPELWIEKNAKKRSLQQGFLKYREGLERTRIPPPPPPPPSFEIEKLSPEQRLAKYQTMWATPQCRPGIRRAIAEHPEWGLRLLEGNGGVVEVEKP
jgi:hypothetical protein